MAKLSLTLSGISSDVTAFLNTFLIEKVHFLKNHKISPP
jgi:hypothetical protein